MQQKRLGALPPRYRFILNPHAEIRCTRCPRCEQSTRLRKFALFIHIEGGGPIVLGKTCRFCVKCALIIVHQDELEPLLANLFASVTPQVIGNDYLVMGTVERAFWRRGLQEPPPVGDMLAHLADFQEYLQVDYRPAGWYRPGEG